MDSDRFDRWTRSLGAGRSRRSALRSLLGLGAVIAGARLATPAPAEARGCAGVGCPCARHHNCLDGLVCCGNSCQTTGACGETCVGNGDACPGSCGQGQPCAGCCGGFCAGYGACTTLWYSYEGDPCNLGDPTACAPGLSCCAVTNDGGVCQYAC